MKKSQEIHELTLVVSKVIRKLKKYSSGFEVFSNFKFTSREEDIKNTQKAYKKLVCELLNISGASEDISAKLSLLTCEADTEMKVDDVAVFSDILEKYLLWKNAMNDFIHSNNELFENAARDFRYSVLISYARTFLNQTESFSQYLKNIKTNKK